MDADKPTVESCYGIAPGKKSMNPLLAQLKHAAFSEVAEVIRSNVAEITLEWVAAIRRAMPQMQHLTFDQLKDSTPQILSAIADAMASDDPESIAELVSRAPAQGLSRFKMHFDVIEVMQEDRLLRSIIVRQVDANLGRRMDATESAALHTAIDVMLQRSVIALVEEQKLQLRAAAETELKFISYLSHDMNNNLNTVTMALYLLEVRLRDTGEYGELEQSLGLAQRSIHATTSGMRQMLDHEQLRNGGRTPTLSMVDLHAVAARVAERFSQTAIEKGIGLTVEVPLGTVFESDEDLLSIVLQNLVGNGLKFSSRGVVRIGFGEAESECPGLWVSDEGPGIAPDKLKYIFDAFKRGEIHGQIGLGLGLAIASRAAQLLGTELAVQTQLGSGSTFRLIPREKTQLIVENSLTAKHFRDC